MKKTAPQFKVGTAKRDDLEFRKNQFKPSPNVYNPDVTSVKSKTASWGFGSSTRPKINQTTNSPGPNVYEIPSKLNEGPKYGMGLKTIDNTESKRGFIPGPGQYDTSVLGHSKMKTEPSFSMGTG